jgi:predicted transcriptional regulator
MNYRSRDDIVSVILDAANDGGLTNTKIMYQAYLSHDQMKEYLSVLIENDCSAMTYILGNSRLLKRV